MLTITLLIVLLLAVGAVLGLAPGRASDEQPAAVTVTVKQPVVIRYRGRSARAWAKRYAHRTRQLQIVKAKLRVRWQPTVGYALHLATAVTGVPYRELQAVSRCESTMNPFATNGRYRGLFQLGWAPFGMSPFDPVANALSAAITVRHDGGWRQWQCKPW